MSRLTARLAFRLSPALARRVRAVGPDSAAARALILLGLAHVGEELAPYADEGAALLTQVTDPTIRAALRAALFNIGSTSVEHRPEVVDSTPPAEPQQVLEELLRDPLADIGIEV